MKRTRGIVAPAFVEIMFGYKAMKLPDLNEYPHRRFNPLTQEWVLVSPHRAQRPWQGQVEKNQPAAEAAYDPGCYLCPGNARAGAAQNPAYTGTFVFDNDFAALLSDSPQFELNENGLIIASGERGVCRVICFSPRHDLTIAGMDTGSIRRVVDVWAEQYVSLGELPFIKYVQIFENRGAIMGASNPHPHGQIWASCSIPNEPAKEQSSSSEYLKRLGTCLLCDYAALEQTQGDRLICDNESFAALVPFWAIWPFEAILISKRHVSGMDELRGDERNDLADIMKRLTTRYDNLFEASFPYSMGFHQRPSDGVAHPEWHLHAHYYPPLLRSAGVRKFMVGYEMLGMPQRDITPETAAARLRQMPE